MSLPAGEASKQRPAPSSGTGLPKCGNCGGALACYCIEWSNLPDSQKCRCASPVATGGFRAFQDFLNWLLPKDGAGRSS